MRISKRGRGIGHRDTSGRWMFSHNNSHNKLEKKFLLNFISVKDGPEKGEKQSEMKEHKKTTWHLKKYTADVG